MIEFESALVTGATGFIGSNLVRRMSAEGIKVYCLVRADSPNSAHLENLSNIEIISVKSSRRQDLQQILSNVSASIVFNLASYGVNQSDRDIEAMLNGNVALLANLLDIVSAWPLKRFIHIGTCSEYSLDLSSELLTEDHPIAPTSLYGAAKAASVIYGNAIAEQLNIPYATLRLFGVYGVGEASHRLVPYLIERLNRDETVDLTPGEQERDLLYIDDVVGAFLLAATSESIKPRTIYNLCSGKAVKIKEVAKVVADTMNKPQLLLQFGQRPYRSDEAMRVVGDNQKFVMAIGWKPHVSLEEGIQRMVNAYPATRQ